MIVYVTTYRFKSAIRTMGRLGGGQPVFCGGGGVKEEKIRVWDVKGGGFERFARTLGAI